MPFNPGMGCAMEYMPGNLVANGHASLYLLRGGTGTANLDDGQSFTTPATTNQFAIYDLPGN